MEAFHPPDSYIVSMGSLASSALASSIMPSSRYWRGSIEQNAASMRVQKLVMKVWRMCGKRVVEAKKTGLGTPSAATMTCFPVQKADSVRGSSKSAHTTAQPKPPVRQGFS